MRARGAIGRCHRQAGTPQPARAATEWRAAAAGSGTHWRDSDSGPRAVPLTEIVTVPRIPVRRNHPQRRVRVNVVLRNVRTSDAASPCALKRIEPPRTGEGSRRSKLAVRVLSSKPSQIKIGYVPPFRSAVLSSQISYADRAGLGSLSSSGQRILAVRSGLPARNVPTAGKPTRGRAVRARGLSVDRHMATGKGNSIGRARNHIGVLRSAAHQTDQQSVTKSESPAPP